MCNEYIEKYSKDFNFRLLKDYGDGDLERRLTARERATKEFAWAIPNAQVIRALAKYSPIVEVGAGTGYWAYLLEKAGARVKAYDMAVPSAKWFTVHIGGPDVLKGSYRDWTLFLCWPPYDTPMAYNCVKNYTGKTVIYIGEGHGGCTGCDLFHEYLFKHFNQKNYIGLLQWDGLHDGVYVYERKEVLEVSEVVPKQRAREQVM